MNKTILKPRVINYVHWLKQVSLDNYLKNKPVLFSNDLNTSH